MSMLQKAVHTNGSSQDLFSALHDEMNQALRRLELGWFDHPKAWRSDEDMFQPRLDVHDDKKQLSIEVELPGVHEKDVSLSISNGRLVIKGQKKSEREEKTQDRYISERMFGAFERVIELPDGLDEDKIQAKFEKGILRIVAPKRADAIKNEKTIPIGT
jgi:HSP20 family protein